MSPNLVPIRSIDDKSATASSGGSSTGKTAGIAVGVVVGVLVIASAIGAYFFFRHRRNKRNADGKAGGNSTSTKEKLIRQGYDKGELGTDNEVRRYEMGAANSNIPKSEEPPLSEWVNEKANHPGAHSDIPEIEGGGVSTPELTGSRGGGSPRPLHELHDPSTPLVELPGDNPQHPELQGSNPASATSSPGLFARRSRPSNPASPVSHSSSTRRRSLRERLSGRPVASRSSTLDSFPSLTTASADAGPSAPPPKEEVPPVGSGHSGEPFSPVSRQGTFSPDPISRQGTFAPPDNATSQSFFSPVSPNSPETSRRGVV